MEFETLWRDCAGQSTLRGRAAARQAVKLNPVDASHKAVLDALLLKEAGVEAGEMTGLPAYFINKRMFACICNGGVGLRLGTSISPTRPPRSRVLASSL